MSLPTERTLLEKVNEWMKLIAFATAAIWAIYIFRYQEITKPNSVPVNITMSLQFKKLTPPVTIINNKNEGLLAVEMVATATNPSAREIYLLPNAWIAWGNKFEKANGNNFDNFVNEALEEDEERNKMAEKYASISETKNSGNTDTVASGRLFGDTTLNPNETITRRIVFHVPEKFNIIDMWAGIPSTTEKCALDIKWNFSKNSLHSDIYYNGEKVLRSDLKSDISRNCNLQSSTSLASFSLWQ
jgi:hypothetical protein